MAEAPKPKRPKAAPKPKDERPQSERFIETAREIECDESGEAFERSFGRIVPPRVRGGGRAD